MPDPIGHLDLFLVMPDPFPSCPTRSGISGSQGVCITQRDSLSAVPFCQYVCDNVEMKKTGRFKTSSRLLQSHTSKTLYDGIHVNLV